jgi:hypothetical protein
MTGQAGSQGAVVTYSEPGSGLGSKQDEVRLQAPDPGNDIRAPVAAEESRGPGHALHSAKLEGTRRLLRRRRSGHNPPLNHRAEYRSASSKKDYAVSGSITLPQ